MKSMAVSEFIIGIGVLFVIEGLLFAAMPVWMRQAMKSVIGTPDNMLRIAGIASAVFGLLLIWSIRH
jgi:uncharacterized protein